MIDENLLKEIFKRGYLLAFSEGKWCLNSWSSSGMLQRLVLRTFDSDADLAALLNRHVDSGS